MKTKHLRTFLALSLILILAACNLPGNPASPTPVEPVSVATTVAETFQALTQAVNQTKASTPSIPAVSLTPSLTPTFTLTLTPLFTPTFTHTITPTRPATNTPIPKPGSIEGSISGYPYGALPALTIVAYGQNPPYNYSWLITSPGSTYFSMSTPYLLPGPFQVVAYDHDGNSGGCPGFVTVISEQTVSCTISDWASAYRSVPSGVPLP